MKVKLIGPGNIGKYYIKYLHQHPGFYLTKIIDKNSELNLNNSDLIIIATPDNTHYELLVAAIKAAPKAIIIEKPITDNILHSKKIIDLANLNNIKLFINYSRRYLPIYHEIKEIITNQNHVATTIKYAKGLKHNGCHAIDLIKFFYGEIINYNIFNINYDYYKNDPTLSLNLSLNLNTNYNNIILLGLNEQYFTNFELEIITDQNQFNIFNDHQTLIIKKLVDNYGSPKGKRLIEHKKIQINHMEAIYNLLDHAYNVINFNAKMLLDPRCALETEMLCDEISKCSQNT